MNEFDLIKKYFVPISSIESQSLSNDGAFFKPKKNLDYVVSTDTIVEKIHFTGNNTIVTRSNFLVAVLHDGSTW